MIEVLFLLIVGFGAFIQSVTGFAMGMIIMATAGALALYPLPELAAIVSIMALVNFVFSLPGHQHLVQLRHYLACVAGQAPGTIAGVLLLNWLSSAAVDVVQLLLGLFIVSGSLSMMLRPVPLARSSSAAMTLVAGAGGGVLAGLFSAAGPILGYFFYRQPWMVGQIRATLMACFATSTIVRTATVGATGGLTAEVLARCLLAVPVVILVSLAVRRWPPVIPEALLKQLAFSLLLVMGGWLVVQSGLRLLG